MNTLYLLNVNRNTGVYHNPIQALNNSLVIAVDESHPETCQTKVLAHAIDLIRYEVDLVLLANLHQAKSQSLWINHT